MKKTLIATLMVGTMVLGMTACGTKPTETTVAPTSETTVETTEATPAESTPAETTPAETTTAETTIANTNPQFPITIQTSSGATTSEFITNINVTNITPVEHNMGEYYDDPSLANETGIVWEAQVGQDVVITFNSDKELTLDFAEVDWHENTYTGKAVLTKDGNTYTLTIPANTVPAGNHFFIQFLATEDEETIYVDTTFDFV